MIISAAAVPNNSKSFLAFTIVTESVWICMSRVESMFYLNTISHTGHCLLSEPATLCISLQRLRCDGGNKR